MSTQTEASNRLTPDLRRLAKKNHGRCTQCSYKFLESDTTYWGYSKSNGPMYVCEKCSPLLEELAQRQYFMPLPYSIPEPSTPLWRYMDFTKFVSLLANKSLYFASAASFVDKFEGAKGLLKNKQVWDEHYLAFFRKAIKSIPAKHSKPPSNEQVNREAERLLKELEDAGRLSRKQSYVSCWHENEYESEAMWRLYSTFIQHAIAIRTTYSRLDASLDQEYNDVQIGRVEYVDLEDNFVNVNDALWRKRKSFEHEREVRALIFNPHHNEIGISIQCEVKTLVEAIVIAPDAPAWFANLVKDVIAQFGYDLPVEQSIMSQDPFF